MSDPIQDPTLVPISVAFYATGATTSTARTVLETIDKTKVSDTITCMVVMGKVVDTADGTVTVTLTANNGAVLNGCPITNGLSSASLTIPAGVDREDISVTFESGAVGNSPTFTAKLGDEPSVSATLQVNSSE